MYEKENENSKRLVGRSACGGSCTYIGCTVGVDRTGRGADAVQTAEVSGGGNIRSTRLPMR
mgnify:CR=1 FL=1